jgi:hypothetical protein
MARQAKEGRSVAVTVTVAVAVALAVDVDVARVEEEKNLGLNEGIRDQNENLTPP